MLIVIYPLLLRKTGYVSYILFPKDLLWGRSTGFPDPVNVRGSFQFLDGFYLDDSGSFFGLVKGKEQ